MRKIFLVLMLLPITALANPLFKKIGITDAYEFQIDINSIKIEVKENKKHVAAILRLNFFEDRNKVGVKKPFRIEQYIAVAKCDNDQVYIDSLSYLDEHFSNIKTESIKQNLDVSKHTAKSALSRFYNISCGNKHKHKLTI